MVSEPSDPIGPPAPVSERDKAIAHIAAPGDEQGGAAIALVEGRRAQLELEREGNRHRETMMDKELGFFGRTLGGEKHAPVMIAGSVVVLGILAFFCCLVAESWYADHALFWSQQGERALGLSGTALGYIFGKGMKAND